MNIKMPPLALTRRNFGRGLAAVAAVPALVGGRGALAAQTDRTIRVAVSDFASDTLDPAMEARNTTLNQLVQMYDTLLEIGPNSELVPGVAEKWEVDESGLIWTFNLRKGIQFHGGAGELTSADVAFSLKRFMNEKAQSPGGSALREIIDSIEEVDPYTIRVHTKQISMNLPYLLSPHQQETGIVFPKTYILDNAGEDFEAQTKLLEEAPIGSGPFRFVSRELANSFTYEALPDHWRSTPAFKTLEILLVPEAATQMAMLRNAEVDIISIIGDQIKEAEGAGLAVHSVPGALNIWVHFTGTYRPPAAGKPTTDVKVRRALSLAIDRKLILETVLAGRGNLPLTPTNTISATADINKDDFADWSKEVARYDPAEARKLLAEAGFPNGFSGIKMFAFTRPGTPFLPQLAEIVAAQWAEVGVKAEIVAMDYGTYRSHFVRADINDATNAGDAAPLSSGARFDALGSLINWFIYDGGVLQFLKEPKLDEDVARAATLVDNTQRRELIRDIWKHINESWIVLPLFDMDALFAVNPEAVTKLSGHPGWPFLGRVLEKVEVSA